MHELCLFFTVSVTVSFTHATYNYTKLYVEITYVFDTCKVEFSYNKCTIIFLGIIITCRTLNTEISELEASVYVDR